MADSGRPAVADQSVTHRSCCCGCPGGSPTRVSFYDRMISMSSIASGILVTLMNVLEEMDVLQHDLGHDRIEECTR